jgi:DNA-binding PadR family transcriptional regulator
MAKTLGEFEQSILFALLELELEEAYGVSIRQAIEARTGRSVSSGAVYTTLDRLRDQGLVKSWVGEPTSERGGRRKRLYNLQPAGVEALGEAVRIFRSMSNGLLGRLDRRMSESSGGEG